MRNPLRSASVWRCDHSASATALSGCLSPSPCLGPSAARCLTGWRNTGAGLMGPGQLWLNDCASICEALRKRLRCEPSHGHPRTFASSLALLPSVLPDLCASVRPELPSCPVHVTCRRTCLLHFGKRESFCIIFPSCLSTWLLVPVKQAFHSVALSGVSRWDDLRALLLATFFNACVCGPPDFYLDSRQCGHLPANMQVMRVMHIGSERPACVLLVCKACSNARTRWRVPVGAVCFSRFCRTHAASLTQQQIHA